MSRMWAVAATVITLTVCVTIYQLTADPRVKAMDRCTAGWPDSQKQVSCAQAIFGQTDRDEGE